MPNYKYKAVNSEGKTVESILLAPTSSDVKKRLREMNMVIISVTEVTADKKPVKISMRIKEGVIHHFTKQLHTLLKAGIPILASLRALKEQTPDENFKEIIESIVQDVEGGSKFSDALSQFPKVFPPIYINSVKVGEISGTLEDTLKYLYEYLVQESQMKKDVKKAFRYPMFVMLGLIGAFFVFTTTVLPNFLPMFQSSGTELPLPTRILLGMYSLITDYGMISVTVLIILIAIIIVYARTADGKYHLETLLLKLPVIGEFIKKVNVARLAKLFYTMNKTGLSITKAFDIMQETIENAVYSKEIAIISEKINRGEEISVSLAHSPYFTTLLVEMVTIGEKSGSLDEMLYNVSEYYNKEVAETVENMTSLIEPIVTVVMGGMVLLLALAMFLPMWDMMNVL